MAAVDAVKVANRQSTWLGEFRVLVASKNLHIQDYRFYAVRFGRASVSAKLSQVAMAGWAISRYIEADMQAPVEVSMI